MARNIGPTVDILLSRVRQSGGIAISTDTATQILTLCQNIVNLYTRSVVTTGTLTTVAERLVYDRTDFTWGKVLDVHESNRKLIHFQSLEELSAYDIDWFRKVDGTRFEGWIQFGLDYLILYPAKAAGSSATITYAKETTIYSDYSAVTSTPMELPDEDVDIALRLAEAVLHVRSRNPEVFKSTIKEISRRLNINVSF